MKGWRDRKSRFKFARNYAVRVINAAQNAQPGTVSHAAIKHDDDCPIFKGKPCNCNPDIEIILNEEQKRQP